MSSPGTTPTTDLLRGKRILVTGVLTPKSIAFAIAAACQGAGAEVVLTSFGRAMSLTQRSAHRRRTATHRYQTIALLAERRALDDLWRSGAIIDEVHRPLQLLLDHEESMLRGLAAGAPVQP